MSRGQTWDPGGLCNCNNGSQARFLLLVQLCGDVKHLEHFKIIRELPKWSLAVDLGVSVASSILECNAVFTLFLAFPSY